MKKGHITLKIFILIILNDLFDGIAQLFIKKGLILTGIEKAAQSPFVWAGILVGLFSMFLWFVILHRVDLSVALPVGSTIYIFVPLMSAIFLKEDVTAMRWAGILLIIFGIHLVMKSKAERPVEEAKP